MTSSDEQFRNGQTYARARAGKKNFSHDLENGFASHGALRVATALIPILTIAWMQGLLRSNLIIVRVVLTTRPT